MNPKFTKFVLTLIVPKPGPLSTMLEMESGELSLKKSPSLLPLKMLLLLRMVKLPLILVTKSLQSPRLLLSSTLSGLTPNNKLDGLNKELPTQLTLLTKLLSTNPGKRARRPPTNGLPMSTKVD